MHRFMRCGPLTPSTRKLDGHHERLSTLHSELPDVPSIVRPFTSGHPGCARSRWSHFYADNFAVVEVNPRRIKDLRDKGCGSWYRRWRTTYKGVICSDDSLPLKFARRRPPTNDACLDGASGGFYTEEWPFANGEVIWATKRLCVWLIERQAHL